MWQIEQAQRCPDCGTSEWEWEADPIRVADLWTCYGCKQVDQLRGQIAGRPALEGRKIRWFPVEVTDGS